MTVNVNITTKSLAADYIYVAEYFFCIYFAESAY